MFAVTELDHLDEDPADTRTAANAAVRVSRLNEGAPREEVDDVFTLLCAHWTKSNTTLNAKIRKSGIRQKAPS